MAPAAASTASKNPSSPTPHVIAAEAYGPPRRKLNLSVKFDVLPPKPKLTPAERRQRLNRTARKEAKALATRPNRELGDLEGLCLVRPAIPMDHARFDEYLNELASSLFEDQLAQEEKSLAVNRVRARYARTMAPAALAVAGGEHGSDRSSWRFIRHPTIAATYRAVPPMAVCSAITDDLSKPIPWSALDVRATQGMAMIFGQVGFHVVPSSFNLFAVQANAVPHDSTLRPFDKHVFTKHGPTKRFEEVHTDLGSTLTVLDYVNGDPKAWRMFAKLLNEPPFLGMLQGCFRSLFLVAAGSYPLRNALSVLMIREHSPEQQWGHIIDRSLLLTWMSRTISTMATADFQPTIVGNASDDEVTPMPSCWIVSPQAPLGQGSFGAVLAAYLPVGSARIAGACKVQSIADGKDESAVQMYLSHDAFLPPVLLWSFGESICREHGGLHFTFVPKMGPSLDDLLEGEVADCPFTAELAWTCTFDILTALIHLEQMGVIHSDVKPANLLFSSADITAPDTTLVLADFGVSMILKQPREQVHTMGCTPMFASPEQMMGIKVDTRADVWAFASTLHCIWFGREAGDADVFRAGNGHKHWLEWRPPKPLHSPTESFPLYAAAVELLRSLLVDQGKRSFASEISSLDSLVNSSLPTSFHELAKCEPLWPWEDGYADYLAHRHHFLSASGKDAYVRHLDVQHRFQTICEWQHLNTRQTNGLPSLLGTSQETRVSHTPARVAWASPSLRVDGCAFSAAV